MTRRAGARVTRANSNFGAEDRPQPPMRKPEANMARPKNVLVIGVDPRTIPGIDADAVEALLAVGQARFEAQGIAADICHILIDETAERVITEYLNKKPYACVVVGGGIRKPEP